MILPYILRVFHVRKSRGTYCRGVEILLRLALSTRKALVDAVELMLMKIGSFIHSFIRVKHIDKTQLIHGYNT